MSKVLSDIFHIKGRFQRSVHLERDFYTDENLLEGYVVTGTALEMLERIVSALENGKSSKAWSLTGPYGSGKSAFALFTANLLRSSVSPTTRQALKLLEQKNTDLYKRFTNIKGNKQSSPLKFLSCSYFWRTRSNLACSFTWFATWSYLFQWNIRNKIPTSDN